MTEVALNTWLNHRYISTVLTVDHARDYSSSVVVEHFRDSEAPKSMLGSYLAAFS